MSIQGAPHKDFFSAISPEIIKIIGLYLFLRLTSLNTTNNLYF